MDEDELADQAYARGRNKDRADAMARRPALTAILEGHLGLLYGPGSSSCSSCPFAEAHLEPPPNRHDPDEGSYTCHLTGNDNVWGESPVCTDKQWKGRAYGELPELEQDRFGDLST